MILNEVNSDDYLYVRLTSDINVPGSFRKLPKGTILRYSIEELRKLIWKPEVSRILFDYEFDYETSEYTDKGIYANFKKKSKVSPQAFLPQYLYESVTMLKDVELFIEVEARDLIGVNDWLRSKLNSNKLSLDAFAGKGVRTIKEYNDLFFERGLLTPSIPTSSALIPLNPKAIFEYQGMKKNNIYNRDPFYGSNTVCDSSSDIICLPLAEGDTLDLSDPVINLLFLNQEFVRFFLNTEIVPEEEKIKLFERDFLGWIPEAERHYFKFHYYLNINRLGELSTEEVNEAIKRRKPDFYNMSDYWGYSDIDSSAYDNKGCLRYFWINDNSLAENEARKIADPISAEEGRLHYEHERKMRELFEKQKELEFKAYQYLKTHKKSYYRLLRVNPNLTPVEFIIYEENREAELKRNLVRRLNNALMKRKNDIDSK